MRVHLKKITIINKIYSCFSNRSIYNLYSKNYKKRVLISYITKPFRESSKSHSNYYEVVSASKIFDELGYVVDVVYFDKNISSVKKYDVIYGFGDVFKQYFESGLVDKKTIYYGAGMHVCHQNNETMNRVKDVYSKKGVWLLGSSRFIEKTWSHQTSLVDGIIALGNEHCANTYRKFYDGRIDSIPAPFFRTVDPMYVMANRRLNANKSYLWFGSSGAVHKGLDLCLDFFSKRKDLTLHICGNVLLEKDFIKCYKRELFHLDNICFHGFLDIESDAFMEILKQCSFSIFPSCSEGGSPSVLTTVGNGALIPIISKDTSVSTGFEIRINELSIDGIEEAVNISQGLTESEIIKLQHCNVDYVLKEHSQGIYYEKLRLSIKGIIDDAV